MRWPAMSERKRQTVEATDDWQQLQLLVKFPEQPACEQFRPVVLFGRSVAERAMQTATPQRTLYRQVDRFAREGMRSLFGPENVEKHRWLPEQLRSAILELKAEHPKLNNSEITNIVYVRTVVQRGEPSGVFLVVRRQREKALSLPRRCRSSRRFTRRRPEKIAPPGRRRSPEGTRGPPLRPGPRSSPAPRTPDPRRPPVPAPFPRGRSRRRRVRAIP